ncbi:hypothetical protein MRB53_041940 [Persea americana]|nr:hypothetical protein MRB53_041940 [Persea americana]
MSISTLLFYNPYERVFIRPMFSFGSWCPGLLLVSISARGMYCGFGEGQLSAVGLLRSVLHLSSETDDRLAFYYLNLAAMVYQKCRHSELFLTRSKRPMIQRWRTGRHNSFSKTGVYICESSGREGGRRGPSHGIFRQNTTIPIPRILSWGTTTDSPGHLGPFIIMDYVEGKLLSTILKKRTENDQEDVVLDPSIDNSILITIYRQIAGYLLQLSQLTFNKIGAISKDNTGVVYHKEAIDIQHE